MTEPRTGLKGIVHVHSTRSYDGTCDYARLRALFTGAGLDFACMTEHVEGLAQPDIDAIVEDCRRHSDDAFLFVPGIEMDCFYVYLLGIGPGVKVDFTDDLAVYRSLRRSGAVCVLSHPVKARFRYPAWVLDDCSAVEVLNAKHDGRFFFRPGSERLLARIRKRRPQVAALVGLDFHAPRDLCPLAIELTEPTRLEPAPVIERLVRGATRFHLGGRPLDEVDHLERALLRARLGVMDAAHFGHRLLARRGVTLPKGLRRRLAAMLEGRG